jgi:AcrR family transcriptional regulator
MTTSKKIPDAPPEEVTRRTRGRPRKPNVHTDSEGLSREAIILKAAQLAKGESLDEISMVRVARELGVVPGLIHYYVGSRDDLLSGVINHYFRARMEQLPLPTGDWKEDMRRVARASIQSMMEYRGVAGYIATHNRFRLFQKVGPDETDYGLEFFNRVAEVMRCGGLSPKAAALGYHLLMQFIVASAANEIGGQTPGRHEKFIRTRLLGLDKSTHAGALYIAKEFSRLDFTDTFESGLEMLLAGIERLH